MKSRNLANKIPTGLLDVFLHNNLPIEIIYIIYGLLSPEDLYYLCIYFDEHCKTSKEAVTLWREKGELHFPRHLTWTEEDDKSSYHRFWSEYYTQYMFESRQSRALFSLIKEQDADGLRKKRLPSFGQPVKFCYQDLASTRSSPTRLIEMANHYKNQAVMNEIYAVAKPIFMHETISDYICTERKDEWGFGILYWVIVMHQPLPELEKLRALELDPNERNGGPSGQRALSVATQFKNVIAATFLLKIGANPLLHGAGGSIYEEFLFMPSFSLHNSGKICPLHVHRLLPLHMAAYYNQTEIARAILERNVSTLEKYCCNNAPFHIAAGFGNIEMMKLFLSFGADINIRQTNDLKSTPLFCAAIAGEVEAVRFLLEHDADYRILVGSEERIIVKLTEYVISADFIDPIRKQLFDVIALLLKYNDDFDVEIIPNIIFNAFSLSICSANYKINLATIFLNAMLDKLLPPEKHGQHPLFKEPLSFIHTARCLKKVMAGEAPLEALNEHMAELSKGKLAKIFDIYKKYCYKPAAACVVEVGDRIKDSVSAAGTSFVHKT